MPIKPTKDASITSRSHLTGETGDSSKPARSPEPTAQISGHGNSPSPQNSGRLLNQLGETLRADDPAKIVKYTSVLGNALLADGITADRRLVKIRSKTEHLPSMHQSSPPSDNIDDNIDDEDDDDDEFFDARETLDPPDTQSEVLDSTRIDLTTSGPKEAAESALEESGSAPSVKMYRYVTGMISDSLRHLVEGITGKNVNQFLQFSSEVYRDKKPKTFTIKKLTLPDTDNSYCINNASITIHSVKLSEKNRVQIQLSVDGTMQYPSATGETIAGKVKISHSTLDLTFDQEDIPQLLTTGSIAPLIKKIASSYLYAKLPGWKDFASGVKKMLGRATPESQAGPSIGELIAEKLKINQIALLDADIHVDVARQDAPGIRGELDLKSDKINAVLSEDSSSIQCTNTEARLSGNQYAGLLPFSLSTVVQDNFPRLEDGHTSLGIKAPDISIKQEEKGTTVAVPEGILNSEGDIEIENGRLQGVEFGTFDREKANIIAAKVSDITADRIKLPAGSLNMSGTEEGSLNIHEAQLTLMNPVTEPTDAALSTATTTQETTGISLLKRVGKSLVGWIQGTAEKPIKPDIKTSSADPSASVLALQAGSINGDIRGNLNVNGKLEGLGLLIDSQADTIHLQTEQTEITQASLTPIPDNPTDEVLNSPVFKGSTKQIKLTAPKQASPAQPTTITIQQVRGDIKDKEQVVEDMSAAEIELAIRAPGKDVQDIQATARGVDIRTSNIAELKGKASLSTNSARINSHLTYRLPNAHEQKRYPDKWKQLPVILQKSKTEISCESSVKCEITPANQEVPVLQANEIIAEAPSITLTTAEDPQSAHDATGKSQGNRLGGEFTADSITAKGSISQLASDRQIKDTCNTLIAETPELKESIKKLDNLVILPNTSDHLEQAPSPGSIYLHKPSITFMKEERELVAEVKAAKAKAVVEGSNSPASGELKGLTLELKQESDNRQIKLHTDRIQASTKVMTKNELPLDLSVDNLTFASESRQIADESKQPANENKPQLSETQMVNIDDIQFSAGDTHQTDRLNVNVRAHKLAAARNSNTNQPDLLAVNASYLLANNIADTENKNTSIKLSNVRTTLEYGEEVKVCSSLDSEHSTIKLNNLPELVETVQRDLLNRKEGKLPVEMDMTTDIKPGTELTGTVNAKCKGNIGDVIAYFIPAIKRPAYQSLLTFISQIGKRLHFEIKMKDIPVEKAQINIATLMQKTEIKLKFKGSLGWLFKPFLAFTSIFSRSVITRRLHASSKSVDTRGFISLRDFLTKSSVHLVSGESLPALHIPSSLPYLQRLQNEFALNSSRTEVDKQAFIAALGEQKQAAVGSNGASGSEIEAIVTKHGLPKTTEDLNAIYRELGFSKTG